MADKTYNRVYLWELPVRIFHWVNAISIVVLCITGFLIADPPAMMHQGEAWNTFTMGYIRVIHFIAAYFFTGAMILRLYWAFAGNKYARLKAFLFPFTKAGIKEFWKVLKYDIFLFPAKENYHRLGHNSIAALSYLIMFFFALIMVFTGFALYADNASWWFPKLFAWVQPALGGDFGTRLLHHISMWIIIFITIVHIYLVIFHDVRDKDGEISSMVGGYKFEKKS